MPSLKQSPRLRAAAVAFMAGVLPATGGCAQEVEPLGEEEGYFLCVDDEGVVVEDNKCDDSDSNSSLLFWYVWWSTRLPMGHRLSGADDSWHYRRFRSNDSAARVKYGLAPSGPVTTSKTIKPAGAGGVPTGS